MLTSLFSLFYVTGEFHRFLHRGRARVSQLEPSPLFTTIKVMLWSFSHVHVPSLKLAEVAFDTLCFWELHLVKISSPAFVIFTNVNVLLS